MANPYYVKYGIKFKITKKYEVKFISSVKKNCKFIYEN